MANEQGTAQCLIIARNEMWFAWKTRKFTESSLLERSATEGDSPVSEKHKMPWRTTPKYRRARGILRESAQTIG